MKSIVNRKRRPYRSELRDEQAEATRDRILEATARVLAGGVAGVSIPAIAEEAGVSIATVYRIFGTKRGLIEAIYPYSVRRANRGELRVPTSFEEFREGLRYLFDRVDSMDEVARAAVASRGAEEVRHATMGQRLEIANKIVDALAPGLKGRGRERVLRLVVVLATTASLRMWRDHLEVPVDEAIDDIEWTFRAAVSAARAEAGE
jgi:AcrR family transcriptional regulator